MPNFVTRNHTALNDACTRIDAHRLEQQRCIRCLFVRVIRENTAAESITNMAKRSKSYI